LAYDAVDHDHRVKNVDPKCERFLTFLAHDRWHLACEALDQFPQVPYVELGLLLRDRS
jgi:hypothetical protein